METYLISVLATVLVCGAVQYLSGEMKLRKQLIFVSALCVVFSLLAPIITWLPKALQNFSPEFQVTAPEENTENQAWILAEGKRAVEGAICKNLQNKIGLKENDVSVKIDVLSDDIENIKIEKIYVYLVRQTDGYLANDITKYLSELFGCTVTVQVGRGKGETG